MHRLPLLGLFFFLTISFICPAQVPGSRPEAGAKKYYLLLQKPGRAFRHRFFEGATITLKLAGDKKFYTGRITAIEERSFVFLGTEVRPEQVAGVRLQNHTALRNGARVGSTLLRKGGGLFTMVGAFNAVLSNQGDGVITMGIGMSAMALGKGLQAFQRRSYRARRGWVLQVL